MKLTVSPRASNEIRRIDAWWREHRDAPAAFTDDLAVTLDLVASSPNVGALFSQTSRGDVRRVLLATTRHHVYYRVESADAIRVLSVWSAVRRRGPKLAG